MKEKSGYVIRSCKGLEELADCVRLQKEIWGYADTEVYPLRLFVTLNHIGGHVIGAFTAERELVGFVGSMPAWHNGRRYFRSLSLAVLATHQNRGLGRALKLEQRKRALRSGVDRIEWTYDPMQAKNAFFNLERLGAIARVYLPDHYGPVCSSLQLGLPSDRLLVEWRLRSARVNRVMAGRPARATTTSPAAVLEIPLGFSSMAESRPEQARAQQLAVRQQLQKHFKHRLVITGFEIAGQTGRYTLERDRK